MAQQESIREEQAVLALLFLDAADAARTCATSKTHTLGVAARHEALWTGLMARIFRLAGPSLQQGPCGEDCGGSAARAFRQWQSTGYESEWQQLRAWLKKEAPAIHATLRPGVRRSAEEHRQLLRECDLEDCLGPFVENPYIFGLWEAHDGQEGKVAHVGKAIGMQDFSARDDSGWANGLFGGYTAYDHKVCSLFLPLKSALLLTQFLRSRIDKEVLGLTSWTLLVFAVSFNMRKGYCVDVNNGNVFVLGLQTGRLEPAAPKLPSGTPVTVHSLTGRPELNGRKGTLIRYEKMKGRWQVELDDGSDSVLLKIANLDTHGAADGPPNQLLFWFKEYVRRLRSGWYEAMELQPEAGGGTRGIRLFAQNGPTLSKCVTRGVEVTASCLYMPEHPQQGWTYSIGFKLVGTAAERGFETCQLARRVWNICEDGQRPERVEGDGVIGLYPILCEGGWLLNEESDPHSQYQQEEGKVEDFFRYQSCSGPMRSMSGSFSGQLQFYPGTRQEPSGAPFFATMDPFKLCLPEYLY